MKPVRKVPLSLAALVALGAGACTWVSDTELNLRIACLDEDGDGTVRTAATCNDGRPQDCDESRADRSPLLEEIAYDGIDNDCDVTEQDVLDIDGDTYPGKLKEEWEPQHDGLIWPANLKDEQDCDDAAATVFPGAAETPYDGVDSDCGRALDPSQDDHDVDGDGHVPPADRLPAGAAPYAGDLPQDDCDDTNAQVSPSTDAADAWYDGVDQDCDQTNDFDRDGDAYVQAMHFDDYTAFLDRYGYADDRVAACQGDSPSAAACGDCDDNPDDDGDLAAADVNPGADEIWYDGDDQDCDQADDFDQDGDAFIPDESGLPVGHPPYTGSLPAGDCDDTAPALNPGRLEHLGDTVDQDCDGGESSTPFAFGGFTLDGSRPPRVDATTDRYVMGLLGDFLVDADGETDHAIGIGPFYTFARPQPSESFDGRMCALPPVGCTAPTFPGSIDDFWEPKAGGLAVGEGLGMAVATDVILGTSVNEGTQRFLYLKQMERFGSGFSANSSALWRHPPSGSPDTVNEPYAAFDAMIDANGDYWLLGCGPTIVHYLLGNSESTQGEVLEAAFLTPAAGGEACFLEPSGDDAIAHVFDASGHSAFVLGGTASSVTATTGTTWDGYAARTAVRHEETTVLAGRAGGTDGLTYLDGTDKVTVLVGDEVYAADGRIVGGTVYLAALVDRDTNAELELLVLHGPAGGTLTEVAIPFTHPDLPGLAPTGVSLYADDTRILLGVSGEDGAGAGATGWIFLGPP